jgi:uncharacterized protein
MESKPPNRRSFLSARWERLLLVTYAVNPELLSPYLPPNIELDCIDGNAFVSLVAFDFLNTKVLGIPWPGYRNFPEVNLRFYVRHPESERRGVVFIREYVPKKLIAWIANSLYNEPYFSAKMDSNWIENESTFELEHSLTIKDSTNKLKVRLQKGESKPDDDTLAHFFKEHSWGFGQSHSGQLLEYEVWHPIWNTLPIIDLDMQWDWASVYGEEWAFLSQLKPFHTAFAIGSEIKVFPKNIF